MRLFGFEITVTPVRSEAVDLDAQREVARDKLGQLVAGCIVEDFDNDAYAVAVLGRLEDRIRIGLAAGMIP